MCQKRPFKAILTKLNKFYVLICKNALDLSGCYLALYALQADYLLPTQHLMAADNQYNAIGPRIG